MTVKRRPPCARRSCPLLSRTPNGYRRTEGLPGDQLAAVPPGIPLRTKIGDEDGVNSEPCVRSAVPECTAALAPCWKGAVDDGLDLRQVRRAAPRHRAATAGLPGLLRRAAVRRLGRPTVDHHARVRAGPRRERVGDLGGIAAIAISHPHF